jgi:hypothetical protein
MKRFKTYITEAKLARLSGGQKTIYKIIIDQYVKFLLGYFNLNVKIKIKMIKPNKSLKIGHTDFGLANQKSFNVSVKEASIYMILKYITHEIVHVKQIVNLELTVKDSMMLWNNKEIISVTDYAKNKDISTHKKLPWEAESYKYQEILLPVFGKSDLYTDLRGKDATIDWMMDQDAILNF